MDSSRTLTIQSHRGPYHAEFEGGAFESLGKRPLAGCHFIVDERVATLYAQPLAAVLASPSVLLVEANEPAKTLDRFTAYAEHLISRGIRRNHTLVAIGGGVIQDICAFLASTLSRGIPWEFYPTTLLAQADSCIGSKSSINVGKAKNMMGTFCPPRRIFISLELLSTLPDAELRSGIGEMLKAHAIHAPASFDAIARDYGALTQSVEKMETYVRRSLEIKQVFIEQDEFDTGARNVMNYGHSFGHALEAATDFGIPHGIAVTLGMDMANYVSVRLERSTEANFRRMHEILRRNASGFTGTPVPLEAFYSAIGKDKKNVEQKLALILPDASGRVAKTLVENDNAFRSACEDYLSGARAA